MILTIDNPVALPSDVDGLRSASGNSSPDAQGGLFSQILSSQEAKPAQVDEALTLAPELASELAPQLAKATASGTLLPGGGNDIPALEGNETRTEIIELTASLSSPAGEVVDKTPDDALHAPNTALNAPAVALNAPTPVSNAPTVVLDAPTAVLNTPIEVLDVEQPKVVNPVHSPGTGAEPLENNEERASLASSPVVQRLDTAETILSPAADPSVRNPAPAPVLSNIPGTSTAESISAPVLFNSQFTLQSPGRRVEPSSGAEISAPARLSAVVEGPVPVVQKPETLYAIQDALADMPETLKVQDGLAAKSSPGNAPASSQPVALAIAQSVNETNSPSALRPASSMPLSTAVGDPNWNQEFTGRIGVMVDKGISEAKLQLTPAELGRMEIKITTEGDQAKILFTVQNVVAREAIEQAMPRLREMLSEGGLQLAHSEVADHSASKEDNRNFMSENPAADSVGLAEEIDEFLPRSVVVTASTMVDYYV